MNDKMDFGEKIKKIRKDNKLTQKDLADKLNVTYQAVSKWERGENLPDILIIKEISKLYKIDINELMDLDTSYNNKKYGLFYIIFGFVILSIVIGIVIFFVINNSNKDSFEMKSLKTTCSNFNLSGSIAYDKNKTSIHISSIDYCGLDDKKVYKDITAYFYEKDGDTISVISSSPKKDNITLDDYLSNLSFKVDHYSKTCKMYSTSDMYIELDISTNDGIGIVYKVPLELEDNCN